MHPPPMRTVLVIDDDDDVADLISDVLRDRGHTVFAAPDGEHALARLGAVGIDVILLDLSLPDMSGDEFLEMRERVPRLATTRVVILSGSEEASTMAASRNLAILRKPFGAQELLRVVEDQSLS